MWLSALAGLAPGWKPVVVERPPSQSAGDILSGRGLAISEYQGMDARPLDRGRLDCRASGCHAEVWTGGASHGLFCVRQQSGLCLDGGRFAWLAEWPCDPWTTQPAKALLVQPMHGGRAHLHRFLVAGNGTLILGQTIRRR